MQKNEIDVGFAKVFLTSRADKYGRYERWGYNAGKAGAGVGFASSDEAVKAAKQAFEEWTPEQCHA